MKLTPEQEKVRDTRDKNIIVSAAAGSGKTAVLTERIASKICDKEHPSSIDRMLIVTFTNAAAGEMRERIAKKLREKLAEEPENTYLRKQIALIHTAQITTIDSFCLFILKNHFEEIGVDPAFRVCNEGERRKLLNEAFDDAVEEAFLSESESFRNLVEMYAPKGKFEDLKGMVFNLYAAVSSSVFPYDLLEGFIVNDDMDVWEMPVIKYITDYENIFLEEALNEFKIVKNLVTDTQLTKHDDEAKGKISFIEKNLASDFKGRVRFFADIPKVDLKYGGKKFDDASLEVKEEATARIKKGQAIIDRLLKDFHYTDVDNYEMLIKKGYECTNAIIEFMISFMKNFDAKKRDEGVIDFSDMEHMALQILINKENRQIVLTQTALSYRDFFEEVMIDEYQDSNEVQEAILGIISKDEKITDGNRFMVGDIKQSIYGFRMAKPEIFKEKCEKYQSDETGKSERINLSKNFRSRDEVINAVNFIFERIMKKEIGGVEYDENERLYTGKTDYPEATGNKAELLYFLNSERTENEDTKRLGATGFEAIMVAQRIKELVEAGTKVYDKKTDSMREMQYSDIAILLRSTGGREVTFQKTLKDAGIPAYVISKSGYYSAPEVQLILNFLSVIDNPRQDLPLLAVLHSFIGGFDEESIAKIRIGSKKKRLIDSLYVYILSGEDEELKEKLTDFTNEIDQFRRKSVFMSASDIIREIYDRYEYTTMVSAMPGGEQRLANVKLLIDTADEYEEQGLIGIHDFIKSIEKLRSQEIDMGEANILDENANVVRIMTIHKSKGLEYPVCFVSSLHTAFKTKKGKILFDDEFGIGGESFDLVNRTQNNSPIRNFIATKKAIADRGEEIRVLYVALTRAREKLILTGELSEETESKEDMSFYDLMDSKSFMNLVYPIIKENTELFELRKFGPEDIKTSEALNTTDKMSRKELLLNIEGAERFREYKYHRSSLDDLFVKTTVSELKKAAYLEREDGENTLYHKEEKRVPKVVSDVKKENGGAARGSAYHRVMELMDFANIYTGDMRANLEAHRKKMVEKLFIYEEDDALVDENKVIKFLETDLCRRMSAASKEGKLYLEQPFVLSVAANEVKSDFPEDERILVQGVIDVYFEENGKLVLMDYKTDRVDSAEELIKRYKTQLDYYSEALSRLERKEVAEIYIYSFSLGEVIRV